MANENGFADGKFKKLQTAMMEGPHPSFDFSVA
jgi:hypothetical protein